MSEQHVLIANEEYTELDSYFRENDSKAVFLVCDKFISSMKIGRYFDSLEERTKIRVIKFSNFKPNPIYESVVEGVELFRSSRCDSIVAVGGGSAMDVAKCIKLYSNMDSSMNYLKQKIIPNDIKLLAVPTTAGTGSEATRYAVIYFEGVKQSVTDYSCIPSTVLFDSSVLRTLPEYQKKSTMMDAFCHAIESFWSVNSNCQSREYSKTAIEMIIANKTAYLKNEDEGNANMLKAANLAGKAINITQTTAGHAMCYKLTSLYGIAHGHGAALCISVLFPYMVKNIDKCIDPRGPEHLNNIFTKIAAAMGCNNVNEAVDKFDEFLKALNLTVPKPKEEDYDILKNSVNPVRLQNNPIGLSAEIINELYHQIFMKKQNWRI